MNYSSFVLVTALVAFVVFRASYGYFGSEETSKAEGRLSLYEASVTEALERYSHLTYVLSQDPFVIDAALGGNTGGLNERLEDFAAKAELDAIYLMQPDGLTIAASNHGATPSFLGQNYAFRPYFRDALTGIQGRFYAIGATTGQPGYFIADAVKSPQGDVAGVVAIKIDFSVLARNWRNAGEDVFLANRDGVVLLASDAGWLYKVLTPLTQTQQTQIDAARQFTGQALTPLDWAPLPNQRARIAGHERIHLAAADLPHAWTLHYFASDDRAVARSGLVTAFVVFAAGLGLIGLQIQRARRVGRALARSEREEAQLRDANERLAVEIEERRTAERRLQRAQGELARASRLAALGQLAASVTHELGQPIAAMRNHLTAAELGGAPSKPLLPKIGGLVDRMEGITRQLKFFARSDSEAFADVDLCAAMRASLALVEPNIAAGAVAVTAAYPDAPMIVRGNALRIEQVFTNLLRNAIDAVEDMADPRVDVTMIADAQGPHVTIQDNGHGMGQATLEELQEPFVTTRESGHGMGLGLAISASILRDHDAEMAARNLEGGAAGAAFEVRFRWPKDHEESDNAS